MSSTRVRQAGRSWTFGLALGFLVSSCATAGQEFKRPESSAVALDKTTRAEILRQFGEPFSTGQFLRHGVLIDSLHYYYGAFAAGPTLFYKKHCWFYFTGERLVGYSFTGGFPREQLIFDSARVPAIAKGKTTRAEVARYFGEPSGVLRYPVTDELKSAEGDTAVEYEYHLIPEDQQSWVHKHLVVIFDAQGVVKDVVFDSVQKAASSQTGPQTKSGARSKDDDAD